MTTSGPAVIRPAMRRLYLAALIVVAFDQATKFWILDVFFADRLRNGLAPDLALTPFFNLVLVWNTGVSFSLFQGLGVEGRFVLIALALAISAALVVWTRGLLRRGEAGGRMAVATGLVLGGAIGNVIDRLRYGAVADFLDFHAFGYHWPAFNLADSAISVGIALIVFDQILGPGRGNPPVRPAA